MRKQIKCWWARLTGTVSAREWVEGELARTTRSRLEAEADLEAANWAVKFLREREMRLKSELRKTIEGEKV